MSKIARRTLFQRMVLTQVAGMAVFLIFATGASCLAVLPLYLRLPEGTELLAGLATTNLAVAWSVGVALFIGGLLAWFFIAVLIANRVNGFIEWILHRIGIRLGAEWIASEAVVPRVWPELDDWKEVIDATMSELLVRSALVSGQVFLHEFGNYMNAISLRTNKVRRKWQGPPEAVQRLTEAITDAVAFLDDLSKLVEDVVSDMKPLNVLDVIKEVPRKLFIERTRVKILDAEPPLAALKVSAMKGLLMQVLLNLVRNALERSKDDVIVNIRLEEGQVVIRVEDSAPMDERAFQELFIIPPAPRGPRRRKHFGLGLPLCRVYMQAMGGSVKFRPANGNGQKAFEISLPLSPDQPEPSTPKE